MDEYQTTVPAIVYENETARHERAEKRLLIILLVTIEQIVRNWRHTIRFLTT